MTDNADRRLDDLITTEQAGRRFYGAVPAEGELARKLVREAESIHMDASFAAELERRLSAPQRRSSWQFMPLFAAAVLAVILAGGALLFSRSDDGAAGVHVTDIGGEPGQPVSQDRPTERMGKIALSPDHLTLAQGGCSQPAGATCLEGQVRFWDVEAQQLIADQTITIGSVVTGVAYSPDGLWLAISGCAHNAEDGWCDQSQVWLWSPESKQIERELPEPSETALSQVHFGGEGKTVLATSIDGTLFVWDLEADQVATHSFFQYHTDLTTAAFSADGKMMAFQDENNAFWFWNIEQGQIVGQWIRGQATQATALMLNPYDYGLFSGDQDGTVWSWTWSPIGELVQTRLDVGHYDSVTDLEYSPRVCVSGGADGRLLRCGLTAAGDWYQQALDRYDSPVVQITVSADSNRMAVVYLDNTITLWDTSDTPSFDKLGRLPQPG